MLGIILLNDSYHRVEKVIKPDYYEHNLKWKKNLQWTVRSRSILITNVWYFVFKHYVCLVVFLFEGYLICIRFFFCQCSLNSFITSKGDILRDNYFLT